MPRLDITFVKRARDTGVEIARSGGVVLRFDFPRKGPVPHDFIHLAVEEALGMAQGFWGMVASGIDPAAVAAIAKEGGHASAKRAGIPDAAIVELVQAERIVECFEADLWSGPADAATFQSVVDAACAASNTPTRILTIEEIETIRQRIAAFAEPWSAAPEGARFALAWSR